MKRDERRIHGVHYTAEPLVLRGLRPLFLDKLHARLREASTLDALSAFLHDLTSFTFLDPACGTGNFLRVAYRALKDLERGAHVQLRDLGAAHVQKLPRLGLHQFHGLELDAQAAEIARERLRRLAQDDHVRPSTPNIVVANALLIDWNDILPAERASFVFGNPPFVGMAWMTPEQREDQRHAFAFADARGLRIGRLDYAASFFAKSIAYGAGRPVRFAYLVTNSVCQGEHPRSLGPLFERYGMHVDFAWRPFAWASDEGKRARVHVVIVGFSSANERPKRLFEEGHDSSRVIETRAENINWYLTDGPNVFPAKRAKPLRSGYPIATKGNQPTDGGHLLVETEALDDMLADPIAARYVRRYVQAKEFLWNLPRHCLWLVDALPEEIANSPLLRPRLAEIRRIREASRTPRVRAWAAKPWLFTQIRQPKTRYLALPEVSSEKRRWIPAAFLESNVIAGNKLILVPEADTWIFALLQSSMFMAWVRAMAGRLKSDISISPDLTYCTFPFPDADDAARARVVHAAEQVLHVRTTFVGKSLGDLYEPGRMPPPLIDAHRALDAAVDTLYGGNFRDEKRIGVLLQKYQDLRLLRL